MRFILLIIIIFFSKVSLSYSKSYNFIKLVPLNEPWGSSFISDEELIITEKAGKIKIANIISKEVYEVYSFNYNYFFF